MESCSNILYNVSPKNRASSRIGRPDTYSLLWCGHSEHAYLPRRLLLLLSNFCRGTSRAASLIRVPDYHAGDICCADVQDGVCTLFLTIDYDDGMAGCFRQICNLIFLWSCSLCRRQNKVTPDFTWRMTDVLSYLCSVTLDLACMPNRNESVKGLLNYNSCQPLSTHEPDSLMLTASLLSPRAAATRTYCGKMVYRPNPHHFHKNAASTSYAIEFEQVFAISALH